MTSNRVPAVSALMARDRYGYLNRFGYDGKVSILEHYKRTANPCFMLNQ